MGSKKRHGPRQDDSDTDVELLEDRPSTAVCPISGAGSSSSHALVDGAESAPAAESENHAGAHQGEQDAPQAAAGIGLPDARPRLYDLIPYTRNYEPGRDSRGRARNTAKPI